MKKFLVVTAMSILVIMALVGCSGSDKVSAEQAQKVDPQSYGSWDDGLNYDGYRLEDFLKATGATKATFEKDGATITVDLPDWDLRIQSYAIERDNADPFWVTQVALGRNGREVYAFGQLKDLTPAPASQPELVDVCDSNHSGKPWHQNIEKSTLEKLTKLMTSGKLLDGSDDPLDGLGFAYVTIDAYGSATEHGTGDTQASSTASD